MTKEEYELMKEKIENPQDLTPEEITKYYRQHFAHLIGMTVLNIPNKRKVDDLVVLMDMNLKMLRGLCTLEMKEGISEAQNLALRHELFSFIGMGIKIIERLSLSNTLVVRSNKDDAEFEEQILDMMDTFKMEEKKDGI